MSDMMRWFLAAGLLVMLELFVGTFYLLMVALGIVAGGIAAAAGAPAALQALAAALVGVGATLLLQRRKAKAAARDPNINLDIGQSVTVAEWHDGSARVMYRGAPWDVDLAPGGNPVAGQFTIREIRGSRLIVS